MSENTTDKNVKKEAEGDATAALKALEKELARLSGRIESVETVKAAPKQDAQPKAAEAPKPKYTRSQLREMVNNGTITEDQMDEQLERQLQAKLEYENNQRLNSALTESKRTAKVETEIETYVEKHPSVLDTSSKTYQRVQKEFAELVALGDDENSPATKLKALKIALGPVSGRRASSAGVDKAPETFEETGGSAPAGDGGDGDTGWSRGLTGSQRSYYEGLVNKGIYKSFDDKNLQAELEGARKRARS